MIGIKHLIEFTEKRYEPNDENYLIVQKYFEAYLKRLLFILLRRKNIQYKLANEIISDAPNRLSITEQLDIVIVELTGESYINLKHKDIKLSTLESCIIRYCRPVRNKIAHGSDHNIKLELLDICIKITQDFVNGIEFHLNELKGLSAFDKPSKWGAKRVKTKEGLSKSLKRKLKFKDIKKFNVEQIKKELVKGGVDL